jgi:hypothetical protein
MGTTPTLQTPRGWGGRKGWGGDSSFSSDEAGDTDDEGFLGKVYSGRMFGEDEKAECAVGEVARGQMGPLLRSDSMVRGSLVATGCAPTVCACEREGGRGLFDEKILFYLHHDL